MVYAPNIAAERVPFFRRLAPFLDDTKRLVLMGDWNATLDPNIDKVGRGAGRLGRCESSLVDLMDHTGREMWTNREILDAFRVHFRDCFAHCPDLPLQEFRSYLADFPCLGAAEATSCEGVITECEVRDALK